MEERKSSARKDRLNVLYVALTRAVEGMIIIKKPKESIFDEINISPIEIGKISIRNSVLSVQKEQEFSASVTMTNYGIQKIPEKEDESEKDHEAILFGTALHYTLEMLSTFDIPSLVAAMYALRNRYGQLLSVESIDQIEQRVKKLLENTQFQEMQKGAKVSKEQSLSFEGALKQIDLLLEYDDHCLVIDYKSSKKYMLKHQEQVRYYQQAISHITGKRTEGMIVYLLEDSIILEKL